LRSAERAKREKEGGGKKKKFKITWDHGHITMSGQKKRKKG